MFFNILLFMCFVLVIFNLVEFFLFGCFYLVVYLYMDIIEGLIGVYWIVGE